MAEREQLEQAIAQLEAQRATLGDAVVDASIAALRTKLAALQPMLSSEQRKQATILFADVSGFTAMSEMLDAEEVNDVMNALWQRWDAAIVEHGGVIDKHMRDGLMALWGVEEAREDDPEQAIRAALVMQSELAAFGAERQVELAIRAGLNTGPVLLGDVGTTGEFSAMGDAVNLASRLKAAAPSGGVLISHDTYRHVRGLFDVLKQAPLQVKGKARPARTYLVQRARPRAFRMLTRGVAGIETRMVGRDAELLTLQNMFRDATEDAEARIVTVVGEAGVGKSRLLYEFEKWIKLLPEEPQYFRARAAPETQATPYGLVRRLFAHRFEILKSDSTVEVREKFHAGMAAALNSDQADLVGQLLGFDFREAASRAVRARLGSESFVDLATAHLAEYLRAVAGEATLILLEDIHWADDSSLDLLDYLVTAVPDTRLLVVCLARPRLFERRPNWGEGQESHARINLKPLSRRASRALVREILQKAGEIPPELRDLIVEGAEGNPFYVEELITMLIEDGVIVRGEEQWQIELERLTKVRVPPTLTGVLQARLDSLPRGEKTVLQRASVVGRLFWGDVVTELARDKVKAAQVDELLGDVRDRELIFRREHSVFEETDEYIFKHALLRDVTYETVLLKLRRVYHAQVAQWLENTAGERISEYLSVIARHYELAGKMAAAVEWYGQAGKQAVELSANEEAIGHLNKGLDLLQALPDSAERIQQELGLLLTLGSALVATKGLAAPEVEQTYSQARELCGQMEATTQLLSVLYGLGVYYLVRADYQVGYTLGKQLLDQSQRAQDLAYQVGALFMLGGNLSFQGELESSREYLEQCIALYDPQKHQFGGQDPGVYSLTYLAYILWLLGYPDQALRRGQEVLALAHELDHPYCLAFTFCMSAVHHYFHRAVQIVQEFAEATITVSTEYGFAQWLAHGSVLRSWALAQQGQGGEEDCAQMRQAIDAWQATGAELGLPYYLLLLAETLGKLGQVDEGLNTLTEALTTAHNNGEYWIMAELLRLKGELLLAQGADEAEVEEQYKQAIEVARRQSARSLELRAVMSLSRLWQKQGKGEQARRMLEEIYGWFTEGFDTADLQEAKALLRK